MRDPRADAMPVDQRMGVNVPGERQISCTPGKSDRTIDAVSSVEASTTIISERRVLQLSIIELMHARIDRSEAIDPITTERSMGVLRKRPLSEAALFFGSV